MLASNALKRSGLLDGYAGLRDMLTRKSHTVIVMYHRVVDRAESDSIFSLPQIVVYQDSFERHIAFLSTHYDVLPIDQYIDSVNKRIALPSKTAIITFDDGWRDNYLYAFPVLKRYNTAATIFLTTGFIGTNRMFWQEELIFLVSGSLTYGVDIKPCFARAGLKAALPILDKLSYAKDSNRVILEIIDTLKRVDIPTLTALIQDMKEALSIEELPYAQNTFLDWDQIRQMQGSNIGFGSHGISHALLDSCTGERIRQELMESKKKIERELSCQVRTFAYPNGNYNVSVIKHLQEAGYEAGFTVQHGLNTQDTDPYRLRRINICEDRFADMKGRFSEALFAARLSNMPL
ncbi:MAG: polysaccharide deacetylase family protein [Nitrospirae bacterium]|nr:polysaccharide deacetylase family protein [Nitrospirota bacterium]